MRSGPFGIFTAGKSEVLENCASMGFHGIILQFLGCAVWSFTSWQSETSVFFGGKSSNWMGHAIRSMLSSLSSGFVVVAVRSQHVCLWTRVWRLSHGFDCNPQGATIAVIFTVSLQTWPMPSVQKEKAAMLMLFWAGGFLSHPFFPRIGFGRNHKGRVRVWYSGPVLNS